VLRRAQAEHILRAAAGVTGHDRFVVVGTGAVILSAKRPIPARMMLTREVDVCADGVDDPEALSDLIDATIGPDSQFHKTFGYYGDGVSPRTAMMPLDWRARATEHRGAEAGGAVAICPDPNDIALAKLCAWREKDIAWLREAVAAGVVALALMRDHLRGGMPEDAPPGDEIERRLRALA
jgi:hypothetical protein